MFQEYHLHYLNEENIYLFLLQVFILLFLAKGLGEIFRRFNQPSITAEILVGIILGPTLLGRFAPGVFEYIFPENALQQNMLETVGWFGILFFLLKTGLEMDFSSAWRQRGDALVISLIDVVIPIVIAFVGCLFLPSRYIADPDQRLLFCVFIATIMTISALPVTARILQDLRLYKTDLGFLIMCALSLNDIIGWLVFTLVLGFVTQESIDVGRVFVILFFTIVFTLVCLTGGRSFSNRVIHKIQEKKMPEPGSSLTFVSLAAILCGAITVKIGIHALFGFFIAGIMAGESQALSERTRNVISQMVHSIFVPLFFAMIGLKIDFFANFDWKLISFILFIGVAGRFVGAWVGVSFTKQSKANRMLISIAHTPGGEMQIVVGILGLEYGLITETVFVAIVFGAVMSSVVLGPWMSFALSRRKEVSIEEFFLRRGILEDLKATSRQEAVGELCDVVAEQANIPDGEKICRLVLDRESKLGTAIENGCAIPHARLEDLKKPVIAFGRSKSGVDWNSPDGKDTHFVFLILTPVDDNDAQLAILRAISMAIGKEEFRESMMRADDKAEIWQLLDDQFAGHKVVNRKKKSNRRESKKK